jgi:hypothetical protein
VRRRCRFGRLASPRQCTSPAVAEATKRQRAAAMRRSRLHNARIIQIPPMRAMVSLSGGRHNKCRPRLMPWRAKAEDWRPRRVGAGSFALIKAYLCCGFPSHPTPFKIAIHRLCRCATTCDVKQLQATALARSAPRTRFYRDGGPCATKPIGGGGSVSQVERSTGRDPRDYSPGRDGTCFLRPRYTRCLSHSMARSNDRVPSRYEAKPRACYRGEAKPGRGNSV